jgi:putative glycerol-1-phosphate prenyltransferase
MPKAFAWSKWKILAKLDPEKTLENTKLHRLVKSPVLDAIVVGGTQGITYTNTSQLIKQIKEAGYRGPLLQEVSSLESITPDADYYFIPLVLNAGKLEWMRDAHLRALKSFGHLIDWSRVAVEGYVVCNPDSAVARLTSASVPKAEEVIAYLTYAENILNLPVFYLEYSGIFGDVELLKAVSQRRRKIHLVYGGGIREARQVAQVLQYVDTVVIGNGLYEGNDILKDVFQC